MSDLCQTEGFERWPKIMVIKGFQMWQHNSNTSASMKKRKPNCKEQGEKTKYWGVVWIIGHINIQRASTTTCIVLTTYHNIPTDRISSQRCKILMNTQSLGHKTWSNGQTQPWCRLAHQTLKGEGEDPKDPRMIGTKQKRKEKAKKRNQMSK